MLGHGRTVVVEYSSPNIAKHLGIHHVRTTMIGNALDRIHRALGCDVVGINFLGDWGTQFGMLIAYLMLRDRQAERQAASEGKYAKVVHLEDMEAFYRQAKHLYDTDESFAEASRECVVRLQRGDAEVLDAWAIIVNSSLDHARQVYKRLGVELTDGDIRGESEYNVELPSVVVDLERAGLLTESQGAQCVFLEEFTNADGETLPVIIRKSDGAYLYATTDLAALRHRAQELGADRILYVTDSRQSLHFRQIFAVARRAGFAPENVSLEHVGFGMMLGADGRPFRTREGGTVRLNDLLDKAERLAADLVRERNPELAEDEQRLAEVARAVGIGGVKYADLSQNRTSDYVFSWEKMLSLEGNTAPYMQYACARIRSIFRRGEQQGAAAAAGGSVRIEHPAERGLTVALARFGETVQTVADDCLPNVLCAYLYELAGAFMGFYENCPVLGSDEPLRSSRLMLCGLTERVVQTGLGLLGIEAPERM